jgi:hypothetical protein
VVRSEVVSSHVKEPGCLDAVLMAKQVDRRHDSRLDKSPSVWTLAHDVVATVDSNKVASSVFSLRVNCRGHTKTNEMER